MRNRPIRFELCFNEDEYRFIEEVVKNVKDGDLKLIELVKLFAYFSYFSRRKLIDELSNISFLRVIPSQANYVLCEVGRSGCNRVWT